MKENKILALKYRPNNFGDLIGQELMVQTIINSIKLNKTPNAYLLTGIRGVGKTTTARLIAKALNCEKDQSGNMCTNNDSKLNCTNCNQISDSNHIDVLEMDAASKTGIDDVRELIENSKYSPTSAKYKIFIIDEIHMLSKQAFNGLLKTLEEPPPSLKFILATTDHRKIPVTIMSRCQRFDLKRVNTIQMYEHLKKICEKEKGKITDDGLKLIARSSEGSVRDGISLLDRVLLSYFIKKIPIEDKEIRKILGIADREKLINLLANIFEGNEQKAQIMLQELHEDGLDPKNFLSDILDLLLIFNRQVSLGKIEKEILIPDNEIKLIEKYSENLNVKDIALFWQFTLKTLNDLKYIENENQILEMYISQLTHLKSMEEEEVEKISNFSESEKISNTNEDAIKKTDQKNLINKQKTFNDVQSQLKNIEQLKTEIRDSDEGLESTKMLSDYKDLLNLTREKKEFELLFDLERNIKLISFTNGKIEISLDKKTNQNFIKKLSEKLLEWTKKRWIITIVSNSNNKTFNEQKEDLREKKIQKESESDFVKKMKNKLNDIELIEVKED
tara:strand:- start:172 stop:1854 length:1683 start_codon:yes stop_codon:yes gene_type:complete